MKKNDALCKFSAIFEKGYIFCYFLIVLLYIYHLKKGVYSRSKLFPFRVDNVPEREKKNKKKKKKMIWQSSLPWKCITFPEGKRIHFQEWGSP